jgi:hypothetical protein
VFFDLDPARPRGLPPVTPVGAHAAGRIARRGAVDRHASSTSQPRVDAGDRVALVPGSRATGASRRRWSRSCSRCPACRAGARPTGAHSPACAPRGRRGAICSAVRRPPAPHSGAFLPLAAVLDGETAGVD